MKLECDCQILNNEIENRRKALVNAFGADLGKPGRDFNFFLTLVIESRLCFFLAFDCGLRSQIKQEFWEMAIL